MNSASYCLNSSSLALSHHSQVIINHTHKIFKGPFSLLVYAFHNIQTYCIVPIFCTVRTWCSHYKLHGKKGCVLSEATSLYWIAPSKPLDRHQY